MMEFRPLGVFYLHLYQLGSRRTTADGSGKYAWARAALFGMAAYFSWAAPELNRFEYSIG